MSIKIRTENTFGSREVVEIGKGHREGISGVDGNVQFLGVDGGYKGFFLFCF